MLRALKHSERDREVNGVVVCFVWGGKGRWEGVRTKARLREIWWTSEERI